MLVVRAALAALAARTRGPGEIAVAAAAGGVAVVTAGAKAGGSVPEPVPTVGTTMTGLVAAAGWAGAEFVSD
jgi:hypothetical protein